jgi:hypothetical protein
VLFGFVSGPEAAGTKNPTTVASRGLLSKLKSGSTSNRRGVAYDDDQQDRLSDIS